MTETGRAGERRGDALIEDITYAGPDGSTVEAYLITPSSAESPVDPSVGRAGAMFWHWFDPKAPDGDRTQFVEEAVELAGDGVVSLLPQGRFPWASDPSGAAHDGPAIEAEVGRLRAGLDLLAADPSVDPGRLAIVGHDFGGMLATLAAEGDDRVRGLVIIAATPRWGDWFLPFWDLPDDRIEYLRALRPLDPIERIADVAAPVMFQFAGDDFYIAAMSALEFRSEAAAGAELVTYDGADHAMRIAEARRDRLAFLARHLGPAGGSPRSVSAS
jgi:pimeloyl-ACP methyl ester carboxylesterase